jgi:hypothetical protein
VQDPHQGTAGDGVRLSRRLHAVSRALSQSYSEPCYNGCHNDISSLFKILQ